MNVFNCSFNILPNHTPPINNEPFHIDNKSMAYLNDELANS